MFDKSDRLSLYTNILIAAFGFFVALFTSNIFVGLIFSICALFLLYISYRQNKTAFTISRLDRYLDIHDSNGSKATETQNYAITANRSDNSTFWCKNISSNGSISYININGATPAEQYQENDSIHAAVKFDSSFKPGQPFDFKLTFKHNNAFTETQCFLKHFIDHETKLLHLAVELPNGRPLTSAKVFRKFEDEEKELLPPVVINNQKLELSIKRPLLGAEYCLQWDWPKQGFVKKLDKLFISD